MTSVQELKDLGKLPADQLAARIASALEEAGRRGWADSESQQLDTEVIRLIAGSRAGDSLLAELDLELLAGLLERCVERLASGGETPAAEARQLTWEALDLIRRPAALRRIGAEQAVGLWEKRILSAVEASHLTVGPLFWQRASTYASKVLFEIPKRGGGDSLTWSQVAGRVDTLARGLLSLYHPDPPARIAILSENRLEMALLDLACLTSGLVNVVVPANATDADVGYILGHAKVGTVVVSGREQLEKVEKNRNSLPQLKHIVTIEPQNHGGAAVMTLRDVEARASNVPRALIEERVSGVRIGDLATVMYTSGTTGTPKGIQYSQRNIVFKRFARALALPEIGDQDVFLCYLPLFHTFGRYLELMGCVFWGAKYCFLTDPAVGALIDNMRRHRPSVFISVPRKWIQLHEAITKRADPLHASDKELQEATRDITGGQLRWGLSAAGHLDAEIFRFFHTQGIQLLSGYGMSEATGGITMTPPFQYKDNSLGVALPGIDIKLADEDGELWIRGPYVMMGYLDPPDGKPSFDENGWFRTGDLMLTDAEGHIRLVDRKKEIYKNIKGQTIAPQRIENLFREFESVGRSFLVGDHKEYNTLLIYPNPAYKELDFSAMSPEEIRDHFRSLVVSVNKFVAPYERIVDFAVIDRDLDADKGELTPKGTPRRIVVSENFADVIETLYQRTALSVGGVDLILPNWLFQTLGLTAQDVRVKDDTVTLPPIGAKLTAQRISEDSMRVGSCVYRYAGRALNLGSLLATPRLWLGNDELVGFAPLELEDRQRPARSADAIEWLRRAEPFAPSAEDRDALEAALQRANWSLLDLDHAARLLSSSDEECALSAVRLLERVLTSNEEGPLADPALFLLARGAETVFPEVRRRAFQVLVPLERLIRFSDTVRRFLAQDPQLFDAETRAVFCERSLLEAKIETFINLAWAASEADRISEAEKLATSLIDFLAEYGGAHPTRYRRIRVFLVRVNLFGCREALRARAAEARNNMRNSFFQWLGTTLRIAVDTETGQEYRWEDVIVFGEGLPENHRRRLLSAIKNTPFLSGSIFILYGGRVIRLSDIPPGGVWIRLLGERHGKAVYRVTVQTRTQDSYELAANVNESLAPEQVQEEIDWLIICGDSGDRHPVVEDFGGYLPEQDLWTEEFIPGDTLDREMRRLYRRAAEGEVFVQLWPFLAWNALSAYVDLWQRTGRRYEIADLSTTDVVVPTHDYHRGSRIVSLSARREHRGVLDMLRSFKEQFVDPVEREYPELHGRVGWDVALSSVLEVLGEQEGLAVLEAALDSEAGASDELKSAVRGYVTTVRARGFLPMQLFFAVKRYRRWARLSQDATAQARARTLKEFYDTYGLDALARSHPEVRLRFFRETVFRDAAPELTQGLDELIRSARNGEMRDGELAGAVADLRAKLTVEPDDDYFLARIPFAYLQPEDAVDFVSSDLGGEYQSEIVVTLEDLD